MFGYLRLIFLSLFFSSIIYSADPIDIHFDQPVTVVPNKYFTVFKAIGDVPLMRIEVNGTEVTGSGTSHIVVTLPQHLVHGEKHYIQIDRGAFVSASGAAYAGILDKTSWNFTTASHGGDCGCNALDNCDLSALAQLDAVGHQALDKIQAYTMDTTVVPEVVDYHRIGVVSVNMSNIAPVNQIVSQSSIEVLSTPEKIDTLISDFLSSEAFQNDSDQDYIPNIIETLLGLDPYESDENNNSILDGLETASPYGDTFFNKQWHLLSLGTLVNGSGVPTIEGNDLDILGLYHTYMGYNNNDPLIVQVVDTGVDADHEDLSINMDLTRSYDSAVVGDPSGVHPHGTEVAGVIAARAFNGKGVRGIAPFAKLAGSNWLENQSVVGLETAWLSGNGANEIAISNNSWGSYYSAFTLYETILEQGVSTLRNGKGRIYVLSAGNERTESGNANLQYLLSNRYVIPVAALRHDNRYAVYSSPGANILVSGYSGDYYQTSPTIGTTTIMGTSSNSGDINTKTTWTEDSHGDYTFALNGTSAAAPTVSGSLALVLEACPQLTWRDVRYLVATEAKQIDTANNSWVTNSAGLSHSIDYGFGLINAKGMIETCKASGYTLLPVEQNIEEQVTFNSVVPDNTLTYSFTIPVTQDITVEWVEVTIDNNSSYASDYRVILRSPQGTETVLMTEDTDNTQIPTSQWMDGGFRMSTPAMLNESSMGDWQVDMIDLASDDEGTLKEIKLKIYGH